MSRYINQPWGVEQTDDTNWIGPMRKDGVKVREIVAKTDRKGLKPEALRNNDELARELAALPKLVEALRRLVELSESDLGFVCGKPDCLNPECALRGAAIAVAREELKKVGVS